MRATAVVLLSTASLSFATTAFTASSGGSRGLAYYENPRTLSAVAAQFHLPVTEIAKLNGIKDPDHFQAHGLVLPDVPSTRLLPRYVAWTPAPPRQSCASTSWSLRHSAKTGCADAYCGAGPAGERACLCRDDRAKIELEITSSKGTSRLPLDLSAFNPYGSSTVDIASVDLDADGEPETLVSWLGAVSNGIAEEWRTLVVLKGTRELLRYDSGEFTANTAAVRFGGQCHLASSHYEETTHPLRGPALYLVERTFDPLTIRMDLELVGRRCSDTVRFDIPFDPLASGGGGAPTMSSERGTIVLVRRDMSGDLKTLNFRTSAGTRKLEAEPNPDELRFGDTSAQRVFPVGLVWNDIARRPAILKRHVANNTRVLWLGNP